MSARQRQARRRRSRGESAVTLRQKDWQALRRRGRSSLERGRASSGPTEGASGRAIAAAPISQVKRTARASPRCDHGGRWLRKALARSAAMSAAAAAAPRCTRCTSNSAPRWCRSPATTCRSLPRRHPRRAPALPRVGGAVRRLAHGPAAPGRRRRGRGARDAGAGRRGRPGRRASSATRFFTNAQRRHPRRPDDHAARRTTCSLDRQRRLQGRRHRAPDHAHRPPLPVHAAARARAAGAAGPEGGRRRWRG